MTLSVAIDWAKDGTWTGVGDDVTDRHRGTISCAYGRDQATALSPMVSGTGSFQLTNASRDYSPRNTSSPLYGRVKPARPVRIQRTTGGITYTIFVGHTDDAPINPDIASKRVSFTLLDNLADFRGFKLSTPLYAGLRTGDAIGAVLDAVGWTAGRDLDPGGTFMPWWWTEGTDALTALQDLVAAEGAPAILTMGTSGEIVFRDRHHRLTRAASLTSQGTWRGDGAEPVMLVGFEVNEAWDRVVNSTAATVDVRAGTDYQVVWSSTATVNLTDGETKLITASGSDPFLMAVTPDATDMTVTFGVVTADITRDSGAATTIRLTASGGPAQITSLQLRAIPVPVAYTTQVAATDAASVTDYGPRGYPTSIPWGTPDNVAAILTTAVAQRAQPLPLLTVRFQVGSAAPAARIAAVLARNIGDRITVVEPESQLNTDFFIERIEHQINGEVDHVVTFGLEAAPATQSNVFRFDVAGRGFNDGFFGAGLDEPGSIFQFDGTSGHRFDEGQFVA